MFGFGRSNLDRVDLDIITIIKKNGYCSVDQIDKSLRILTGYELFDRLNKLSRKGKVKRVSGEYLDFGSVYIVK